MASHHMQILLTTLIWCYQPDIFGRSSPCRPLFLCKIWSICDERRFAVQARFKTKRAS